MGSGSINAKQRQFAGVILLIAEESLAVQVTDDMEDFD
jgi:hypothetical protein